MGHQSGISEAKLTTSKRTSQQRRVGRTASGAANTSADSLPAEVRLSQPVTSPQNRNFTDESQPRKMLAKNSEEAVRILSTEVAPNSKEILCKTGASGEGGMVLQAAVESRDASAPLEQSDLELDEHSVIM